MAEKSKDIARVVVFGVVTAVLYLLLFSFEERILALTSRGRWTFVIPVVIAFAMSYSHGNFTAAFWDWLGIRAKK